MRWFNRGLWVLAWGVWAWLGVGLHRELPRTLGAMVCMPALNPRESFEGFTAGQPSFVTKELNAVDGAAVFRHRSALTGEVERTVSDNGPTTPWWEWSVWAWQGYVVGCNFPRSVPPTGASPLLYPLESLAGDARIHNLRTGERRDLSKIGMLSAIHPRRPWALFGKYSPDWKLSVTVLDLQTGRQLLGLAVPAMTVSPSWLPYFAGDHIALQLQDEQGRVRVELRTITGEVLTTLENSQNYPTFAADGKLAWYEFDGLKSRLIVAGRAGGKRVLTHEAPAGYGFQELLMPLRFSQDGALLYSPGTGALLDVRSGKPVWEPRAHEKPKLFVAPAAFEVEETWTVGRGRWEKSFKTYALRRFTDGAFLHRTWRSTAHPVNDSYELFYADGAVHQLPPRVNWPLLTLGQTTLALPLVLLWTILRRRKRRSASQERERLESVQ